MRRLNTSKSVFLLVAALMVCAVCIVGCSGASYKLDRDKSLTTSWGTVLEYKVDDSWSEDKSDPSSKADVPAKAIYTTGDKDKTTHLGMLVKNPKSIMRSVSDDATYGGWLDYEEDMYSKSAEEQAAERNGTSGYSLHTAKEYPDYKDFSSKEMGTKNVNGDEFHLYKIEYTTSYSDEAYAYHKEKFPSSDIEQVTKTERYYAVLKEDQRNVEINTKDERLLNDFLDTLKITW